MNKIKVKVKSCGAKCIIVNDHKYYVEFDGIRLIIEEDRLIGWYRP